MEMDGLLNLWIIKPGCSSRGRGITISNRLERILGIVEHGAGAKQARYTVVATVCTPQIGRFGTKYPDLRGVDKGMFTTQHTVSLFAPKVDCGTVGQIYYFCLIKKYYCITIFSTTTVGDAVV